jgi:hypothetical protein
LATSLLWKRLEPFCEREESSGTSKYGFSLNGSSKQEDFYVANEDELNSWLSDLQKTAICTEIAEDYEFMGEIGEGAFSTVQRARLRENDE